MSKKLLLIVCCCLLSTTACNLIYKQNIQQGNAIEQDSLDQLKLGMTMTQVAYLLGTPAVRDPFHQSRWDYYYSFSQRGRKPTTRLVTLQFENQLLKQMTGVQADAPDQTVQADTESTEAASESESIADSTSNVEPDITPLASPASSSAPAAVSAAEAHPLAEPGDGSDAVLAESVSEVPAEAMPAPAAEQAAETYAEEMVPAAAATAIVVDDIPDSSQHADVSPAQDNPDAWLIQTGAFDELQNARNLVSRMREAGFQMAIFSQRVSGLGERFLVRSEGFATRTEADRQLQQINSAFGISAFLVPPSN